MSKQNKKFARPLTLLQRLALQATANKRRQNDMAIAARAAMEASAKGRHNAYLQLSAPHVGGIGVLHVIQSI